MFKEKNNQEHVYVEMIEESPLGPLGIAATVRGLRAVVLSHDWLDFKSKLAIDNGITSEMIRTEDFDAQIAALMKSIRTQLLEYLNGERKAFDLPLDWSPMTPFQSDALHATLDIPYGQTASYKEIAQAINRPRAARAVGGAEASNPIPLVIPCHRVIGSDGKLHGYSGSGGKETKRWLLQLEGALP